MRHDLRDRVAVPVEGWAAFLAKRHWGGDSGPIEQWFDSGEELDHELTFEEAELWEHVVHRTRLRGSGPPPARQPARQPARRGARRK